MLTFSISCILTLHCRCTFDKQLTKVNLKVSNARYTVDTAFQSRFKKALDRQANLKLAALQENLIFACMQKRDADQLHCKRAADQHLCFCFIDSTITPLPESEGR